MYNNIIKSSTTAKGSSEWFTGDVEVVTITSPENKMYDMSASEVRFSKSARTHWHTHANGQVLFITEGVGYYQEEGKPVVTIHKGNVVHIPANVNHWHGASQNSAMTHVAIVTKANELEVVQWGKPVSNEEYLK